jgi:hypothetical protein
MDFDIDLIACGEVCHFHDGGVEDDALGITDFGDGFNHGVKLCITRLKSRPNAVSAG